MKKPTRTRLDYLSKANTISSVLALISAAAAVPGALRLYRFFLDAGDQKIERENLLGIGDLIIPGLNSLIREPYVSLIILILSVLVPLWVLISLLFKKRRLGRERLTGRGLYWFIVLAGLLGLLIGLGIVSKLLSGDLGDIAQISTDPESSIISITSAASVIAAAMAIGCLGKALNAPEALADDEDAPILERKNGRYAQIDRPLPEEADDLDGSYENATIVMDSPLGATGLQPSVSPAEVTAATVMADEAANERAAIADRQDEVSADTFIYQDEVSSPEEPSEDERSAEDRLSMDLSPIVQRPLEETDLSNGAHGKTAQAAEPTAGSPMKEAALPTAGSAVPIAAGYPVTGSQTAASEPVEDASDPDPEAAYLPEEPVQAKSEILYRLVAYPWDPAKVIMVLREYQGDDFVREWAEIRSKSDFSDQDISAV